jgi:nucleoside-diphosphate-sugar epimerase
MILVTGATGFLGRAVIAEGLRRGFDMVALCRASSNTDGLSLPASKIIRAGLNDTAALMPALTGMTAVVHTAATTSQTKPDWELSYETNVLGTQALIQACERVGTHRFIHISSQSAKTQNSSCYGQTKYLADQVVQTSGLDWTIIKPSVIYGAGERGMFYKLSELLKGHAVVPVIGAGDQPLRPILVTDLAAAIFTCLDNEKTFKKIYDLGGADQVTFNTFIQKILAAQGLTRRTIHLPIWVCYIVAFLLSRLSSDPPVTKDNILGIKHLTAISNALAEEDFGYRPTNLDEGLKSSFIRSHSQRGLESPEALTREVKYFHQYFFHLEPSPSLIKNYIGAHDHYLTNISDSESELVRYLIDNTIDVEAVELALRRRHPNNALSRKFHIYVYLLEAEPSFYGYFINSRQTKALAFLRLGFLVLRSIYKLFKGAMLLRAFPNSGPRGLDAVAPGTKG